MFQAAVQPAWSKQETFFCLTGTDAPNDYFSKFFPTDFHCLPDPSKTSRFARNHRPRTTFALALFCTCHSRRSNEDTSTARCFHRIETFWTYIHSEVGNLAIGILPLLSYPLPGAAALDTSIELCLLSGTQRSSYFTTYPQDTGSDVTSLEW